MNAKRPGTAWLVIVGALVAALGALSIALPYFAGTALVILLGAALVVSGVGEIFQSFSQEDSGRKLGGLMLGIITLAGGAAALANPVIGLEILTLALAVALVVSGIWRLFAARSFRESPLWMGFALSGLLGIALGVMIAIEWPGSGEWAIGTLVGVDLLITGLSLASLGLTLRGVASDSATEASELPAEGEAPTAAAT